MPKGARKMDELLSRAEAGQALRVTPRTLRRWVRRRYGPLPFQVGNKIYYKSADVEAFIENRYDEAYEQALAEIGDAE